MNVNDCPHCGKPALGLWKKSILGPARSTACQSCGKPVSVSWNALLASSPIIFAAIAPALFAMPQSSWIVLLLATFVTSMAMHWYFVRIVARN